MKRFGIMKLGGLIPFRVVAIWTVFAASALGSGDGLSQQYCSSDNTGSDYDAVFNIYQSNGACFTQCSRQNYAFAVVQYQDCWCSNYIPADQQSTGNCNQKCPGYPDDLCGNKNDGLYGYIKLPNAQPSGTAGASSSQASSTTAPSTSSEPSSTQAPSSTSQQPQTSSQQPETSTTPSPSSSEPPSSTSTTSSSVASSTSSTTPPLVVPVPATTHTSTVSATPSPVTSVQTVTISGALVTQTVTSTPVVAPDNSSANQPLERKQISGGAIAGIVIGTMLGIACLLAGAFFLWRRRRQDPDNEGVATGRGPSSPRRNISVLSKTGLLSRARPTSYAEKDDDHFYANTGNNSVRHSMLFGAGATAEGVSPVSPLGSSHDNESRRYSRPMVYDQRLNPSALFANQEANGSRVSIQDNADYSRPLGVMNPDLRASFDSRISRA